MTSIIDAVSYTHLDVYKRQENIQRLQKNYKKDPALLERVVYAFGLLEALCLAGLPFVFKGGTCLMLLLKHPMRLSTDIDIIVQPGTDIEAYIRKAAEIFPFQSCEEQVRVGKIISQNVILNFCISRLCRAKSSIFF